MYTPGLTYKEMLTYQARLRLSHRGDYSTPRQYSTTDSKMNLKIDDEKVNIQQQVDKVLGIMGLTWCKNRRIAPFPSTRGSLGEII